MADQPKDVAPNPDIIVVGDTIQAMAYMGQMIRQLITSTPGTWLQVDRGWNDLKH